MVWRWISATSSASAPQAVPAIDRYLATRAERRPEQPVGAGNRDQLIKRQLAELDSWRAWSFRGYRLKQYVDRAGGRRFLCNSGRQGPQRRQRLTHRILVVDDDQHIREVICVALRKAGMVAREARDGKEALSRFAGDRPN